MVVYACVLSFVLHVLFCRWWQRAHLCSQYFRCSYSFGTGETLEKKFRSNEMLICARSPGCCKRVLLAFSSRLCSITFRVCLSVYLSVCLREREREREPGPRPEMYKYILVYTNACTHEYIYVYFHTYMPFNLLCVSICSVCSCKH